MGFALFKNRLNFGDFIFTLLNSWLKICKKEEFIKKIERWSGCARDNMYILLLSKKNNLYDKFSCKGRSNGIFIKSNGYQTQNFVKKIKKKIIFE